MVKKKPTRIKDSKAMKRRKKKASHFGGKRMKEIFNNKEISEKWDNTLTMRQNYVKLGLLVDVNEDIKPKAVQVKQSLTDEKEGLLTEGLTKCKDLVLIPYEAKSMSLKEQRLLMALIRAHADDYEAMAMDTKINIHQQTSNELRRRVALYQKLVASG